MLKCLLLQLDEPVVEDDDEDDDDEDDDDKDDDDAEGKCRILFLSSIL